MSYPYLMGTGGIVQPHSSFRFRVDLYNLLHKLHDIDQVFTQQVMSADLNFTEGSLNVKVRSPINGALDEFLELLHKDTVWLLRVVLLDNESEPTVGYRLREPFLISHKLSELSYGTSDAVHHEFVFGFTSRDYERLSPSLKVLEP
jgi:hypothetical protein